MSILKVYTVGQILIVSTYSTYLIALKAYAKLHIIIVFTYSANISVLKVYTGVHAIIVFPINAVQYIYESTKDLDMNSPLVII